MKENAKSKRYNMVVVDPPWAKSLKRTCGAQNHYNLGQSIPCELASRPRKASK